LDGQVQELDVDKRGAHQKEKTVFLLFILQVIVAIFYLKNILTKRCSESKMKAPNA